MSCCSHGDSDYVTDIPVTVLSVKVSLINLLDAESKLLSATLDEVKWLLLPQSVTLLGAHLRNRLHTGTTPKAGEKSIW